MDTRKLLEEHEELLPKLEVDREAIIREAYSEKIDTEATWAFWPNFVASSCSNLPSRNDLGRFSPKQTHLYIYIFVC